MKIKTEMTLTENSIQLLLDKGEKINIFTAATIDSAATGLFLTFKKRKFQSVSLQPTKTDTVIQLIPAKEVATNDLLVSIQLTVKNQKITPAADYKELKNFLEKVILLLNTFDYPLISQKKAAVKVQHRWKKAFADTPFFVDDFGSKAKIIWQKRNEMRIEKGAILRRDYVLNKDGSVGLNARMGTQLRQEQAKFIENFVTTEDIILKSVNEIGLFLYFGGTNSWLVLKDTDGKTIDEYASVK